MGNDHLDGSGLSDNQDHFSIQNSNLQQTVYRSLWKFHFWIITVCIGSFYIGFTNTFSFTLMTTSDKQMVGNKYWFFIQVGFYALFATLGALLTHPLSKCLSRRNFLCLSSIIGIVGTLLVWLSYFNKNQTNIILLFGKLTQGIAGGMFSVLCPIFIKQLAPIELSVTFGSFHQFFIVFGLLVVNCFAFLIANIGDNRVIDDFIYQLPVTFPIPLLILKIILLQFVYKQQTPKYLIENQRKQEAKHVIKRLYKKQVYMQIYIDLEHAVSILDNPIYQGYNMNEIRNKIIYLGIYIAVLQQISGVGIVNTYGLYPYQKLLQKDNDFWQIVWSGIGLGSTSALVLVNLFSTRCPNMMRKLTKQLGKRRVLFGIGNLMSIMTLLAAVIVTHLPSISTYSDRMDDYYTALTIIISIMMVSYGLTLGPITWIYLSEILEIKQMSFAAASNWATCFCVVSLIPMLPSSMPGGIENGLIILLVLCCIFAVFNFKSIVQTKNKTPIQIVRVLSNMHFRTILCFGKQQQQF